MSRVYRVARLSFPISPWTLCLLLLLGLSCATTPVVPPSPVNAAGVVTVSVTFDGITIQPPDPNPVAACYSGPPHCQPLAKQVHWDLTAPVGTQLSVKPNPSYQGRPCSSFHSAPYKANPHFRDIQCAGTHCETVGPPRETGCFKYDITVTPSSGKPVTLDPDMIIM